MKTIKMTAAEKRLFDKIAQADEGLPTVILRGAEGPTATRLRGAGWTEHRGMPTRIFPTTQGHQVRTQPGR